MKDLYHHNGWLPFPFGSDFLSVPLFIHIITSESMAKELGLVKSAFRSPSHPRHIEWRV
jgi:hypothetical protein